MTLQKGFNDEIMALTQEPIQGINAGDTYNVVATTQGKNVDFPLRLYASASPDNYVNLSASTTSMGDGGTKVSPPVNGVGPAAFASGKINFGAGTGAITGLGTITLNGSAFTTTFAALTKTNTQWRRFVFCQQSDGSVAVVTSSEAASESALQDYGALAAQAGGSFIGYVDVVAVTGGFYKSNAQASQIIGNDAIFRVGGGGGGGGSASAALALQSVSTPNATLTSGFFPLHDGRTLAASDGVSNGATTDYAAALSISLNTILTASPSALGGGGSTPANATLYYLYLDLDSLASTPDVISSGTETGRRVYPVTVSNFILSTTAPDQGINQARYVHRGTIKSATTGNAWSGTGAESWASPTLQGNNTPVATSLIVSRPATGTAVGSVGSTGQIAQGHVLNSKSFPGSIPAADVSWYGLAAGSGTDGSANANNLTPQGVPTTSVGISNTAGEASALNGTSQYFSSVAAFFNPGNASFACAGWFAPTTWTPAGVQTIFGSIISSSDRSFQVNLDTSGGLYLNATNTAASWDTTVLGSPLGFSAGSYHHIALASSGGVVKLYVDGRLYLQATQTVRALTSAFFSIGAALQSGTTQFLASKVDEFSFANGYALTDADIRRLASYRFDHNAAVATKNQRWTASVYPSGGEPVYHPGPGWLISKGDNNSVFWDFSDLGSFDTVDVILEDLGLSPLVIPAVSPFDTTYVAALPASVAHGQPDIPEVLVFVEDATAGEWTQISVEGKVRVDATNIYFDTAVLPVPAASPNRVRVKARSMSLATVSVPQATAARQGTVYLGGMTKFNKIVGTGNGAQYSTLSGASLTTGDCVWINSNVAETADLSIPAGVFLDQAPNTVVSLTGALTNGVRMTGAKSRWNNAYIQLNPTGAQAKGLSLEANDCFFEGILELNTAQTLTDAVNVLSTALRVRAVVDVIKTLGTITNLETNNSTGATRLDVYGG